MAAEKVANGESLSARPGSASEGTRGISAARIKSIVKDDIEVKSITTEACFIIGRALENFIMGTAKSSAKSMLKRGEDRLAYDHVADAVAQSTAHDFLEEVVPQRMTAAVALARMTEKHSAEKKD